MKKCPKCTRIREDSKFYIKTLKDGTKGLRSYCIDCGKTERDVWRKANKEHDDARNNAYNKTNAERIRGEKLRKYWPHLTGSECLIEWNRIFTKPEGHTWKSFCNLLLGSLPKNTRDHYITKFKVFIKWWKLRGYSSGLPDEAPTHLENQKLAPSWRRLCKVLLRNDYWCKSLAFTQPKSEAYGKYLALKEAKTLLKAPKIPGEEENV